MMTMLCKGHLMHARLSSTHFIYHVYTSITMCVYYRYNGGEGFVPGSMFRKFDRRQGTAYVKNVSLNLCTTV